MSELICPPATLHQAKLLPSTIKSRPILYLPMAAISQSESFLLLSARGELIHSFIQCVNMHELQLLHCAVCHLLINSSWAGWVLGWFQACQGRREGGGGGSSSSVISGALPRANILQRNVSLSSLLSYSSFFSLLPSFTSYPSSPLVSSPCAPPHPPPRPSSFLPLFSPHYRFLSSPLSLSL